MMKKRRAFFWAGAAGGVVAAALAVTAEEVWAQFTNKITTTPVIIQDGQGPAGSSLPYDGLEYCCPTAASMSLSYLGENGFNQLGPANPTAAQQLNLVEVISGLMQTDPIQGTTSNANLMTGVETYLAAKGIGASKYTYTSTASPTVSTLASLNQSGSVVDLVDGYYDTSGARTGGHCVALLSQGINALGQSSPTTVVVNNPLPSTYVPTADLPANSLEYLNTISTSGNLTADGALRLNPSQYPGYLGSTASVIETALTLTINPSQESANNPTAATWTLSGTQTIDLHDGSLTVLAPIMGSGGLTKADGGILELEAADTSSGSNTVVSGTLRSDITSGEAFGTGAVQLQSGELQFAPVAGAKDLSFTAASGAGNTVTFSYGATLALNLNGNTSLSVTLGGNTDGSTANLTRGSGFLGTLVIAPGGGTSDLGVHEKVIVNGSAGNLPALTNGIVAPDIVAQNDDIAGSGDFLTYGANGFSAASYILATATALSAAPSTSVYEVNSSQAIPAATNAQVYALKVDNGTTVSGGASSSLQIGGSGGEAGLILNGGQITISSLNFGASEALIYTSAAGGAIASPISGSGGVTTFGPGTLTLKNASSFTGGTQINSGVLIAANTSGSATGSGAVTVEENATLELSGASSKITSSGGANVVAGGTVLMNGGTIAGSGGLTMNSGSYLFGKGTISAAASISGTIGSSSTDPAAPSFSGVENLIFSGNSTTFNDTTIYSWRLNALDDTAADAGTDWSLLQFTTKTGTIDMGTSDSPFNFTLDLGSSVPDPNSGNAFWNESHQWVAAEAPFEFNNIWFFDDFPSYEQGSFSLSTDSQFEFLYVNYVPVPEPSAAALLGLGAAAMSRRRRPEQRQQCQDCTVK